jgi:hypothetical protein
MTISHEKRVLELGRAIELPVYSDWNCYLFGSSPGNGITWRPVKGTEPNAFWRWMQRLCFGNRWVREIPTDDMKDTPC